MAIKWDKLTEILRNAKSMLLFLSTSTCKGSLLEVKNSLFSKEKNKMFCKLVVKVKEGKGQK